MLNQIISHVAHAHDHTRVAHRLKPKQSPRLKVVKPKQLPKPWQKERIRRLQRKLPQNLEMEVMQELRLLRKLVDQMQALCPRPLQKAMAAQHRQWPAQSLIRFGLSSEKRIGKHPDFSNYNDHPRIGGYRLDMISLPNFFLIYSN